MAANDDSSHSTPIPEPANRDSKERPLVDDNLRVVLITVAILLLNLGLFFVLVYFASLVAGLLAGYLIRERKKALFASFIGTFGAYIILFFMQSESLLTYLIESDLFQEIPAEMIVPLFWTSMVLAAVLLSILGILGAYISNRMFSKSEDSRYQQSGVLE
jgi:MFS family permease